MNRPRIVLDTNVILSAVLCGGNPGEYFALAAAGIIEIYTSPFILEETSNILQQKFKYKQGEVQELLDWFTSLATMVKPNIHIQIIQRKDSDNRILECAVAATADYLVTGDKRDLLPLKEFRGIRILSPIEGLNLLNPAL